MEAKLKPLEEGIANFRAFQLRGTKYFDRAEAVLDDNENRRRDRMAWIKIVAIFLVPLACFLCWHWYIFTEDMIQIDHEWHAAHSAHPAASYFYTQPSKPSQYAGGDVTP